MKFTIGTEPQPRQSNKNSIKISSQAIPDDDGGYNASKPTLQKVISDEDGGDEAAENLLGGKKISKNDFQFLKVIGRGSFGKVYLVKKKDRLD